MNIIPIKMLMEIFELENPIQNGRIKDTELLKQYPRKENKAGDTRSQDL